MGEVIYIILYIVVKDKNTKKKLSIKFGDENYILNIHPKRTQRTNKNRKRK